MKQKLIEYDSYHKATALQKKRNARAAHRIRENQELGKKKKQEKLQELAILDKIKKFKKLDLESFWEVAAASKEKKILKAKRIATIVKVKKKKKVKRRKEKLKRAFLI